MRNIIWKSFHSRLSVNMKFLQVLIELQASMTLVWYLSAYIYLFLMPPDRWLSNHVCRCTQQPKFWRPIFKDYKLIQFCYRFAGRMPYGALSAFLDHFFLCFFLLCRPILISYKNQSHFLSNIFHWLFQITWQHFFNLSFESTELL